MSVNFRFQRSDNFENPFPIWRVVHKATQTYLGEVRGDSAGNYSVRRPSEASFHGTHENRVRAARWLKNNLTSNVVFEDDAEVYDEDSDD